jgi:hypothetical protein
VFFTELRETRDRRVIRVIWVRRVGRVSLVFVVRRVFRVSRGIRVRRGYRVRRDLIPVVRVSRVRRDLIPVVRVRRVYRDLILVVRVRRVYRVRNIIGVGRALRARAQVCRDHRAKMVRRVCHYQVLKVSRVRRVWRVSVRRVRLGAKAILVPLEKRVMMELNQR